MVDPRVCPPKADVELADVVRRFGPQYIFPIRPPDDALAKEGTFGHRRLLHSRAGGTALPL